MDIEFGLDGLVDPLQKQQKLLMAMPRLTFADHCSFQNVEGCEQGGRSVPLVIMRLPLR